MMHSRDRHHAAALTASLSLPRWYETAAELGLISEGRKSTHSGHYPEGDYSKTPGNSRPKGRRSNNLF